MSCHRVPKMSLAALCSFPDVVPPENKLDQLVDDPEKPCLAASFDLKYSTRMLAQHPRQSGLIPDQLLEADRSIPDIVKMSSLSILPSHNLDFPKNPEFL